MTIRMADLRSAEGTISLWAGVLGSPIAWAIQFELTYMLVPWVCTHHNRWLLPLLHIAFLALSVLGGVVSWRDWQRVGQTMPHSQDEETVGRTRFLAALGVMSAALFSLLIVAQLAASFFLDPCRK